MHMHACAYLASATPIVIDPPLSIVAHCKRPVYRASAQYGEKRGFMVERPWALTRDTTVITKMNLKDLVSVEKSLIARVVATMIQSLTHACNW